MKQRRIHASPKVQFFRYVFVGGTATLIDMGTYTGLTEVAGLDHWMALGLSFSAGILTNFGLSREWAFRAKGEKWYWQFLRFLLVVGIVYATNGWLMKGLYTIWPPMAWRNFWVRGTTAIGTLPLSYYLHRRVTFRQGPLFSANSLPLKIG